MCNSIYEWTCVTLNESIHLEKNRSDINEVTTMNDSLPVMSKVFMSEGGGDKENWVLLILYDLNY